MAEQPNPEPRKTISAEELQQLQAASELLQKLQADPEARKHLVQSVKRIHPEVETEDEIVARAAKPYIDEMEALKGRFDELTTKLTEKDKAAEEAVAQAETETAFKRLETMGYTDDAMDKIKAMMVDRKIADPEAAAALFDRQNPAPAHEQPGWAPSAWNLDSTAEPGTDIKELLKDEDRWGDNMAASVLNEVRKAAA